MSSEKGTAPRQILLAWSSRATEPSFWRQLAAPTSKASQVDIEIGKIRGMIDHPACGE